MYRLPFLRSSPDEVAVKTIVQEGGFAFERYRTYQQVPCNQNGRIATKEGCREDVRFIGVLSHRW